MMGAGKSVVGRSVAKTLGWSFVDTDEEVRRVTGQSVSEIFGSGGEERFRKEESRALLASLGGNAPAVVSVGGGAVLVPENLAMMKRSGRVVWLRARPETLAERVRGGAGRPLLAGEDATRSQKDRVLESLAGIEAERRVLYLEVADSVVDVDGMSVQDVVARVVELARAGGQARASEGKTQR
jgi:shikimate kinase